MVSIKLSSWPPEKRHRQRVRCGKAQSTIPVQLEVWLINLCVISLHHYGLFSAHFWRWCVCCFWLGGVIDGGWVLRQQQTRTPLSLTSAELLTNCISINKIKSDATLQSMTVCFRVRPFLKVAYVCCYWMGVLPFFLLWKNRINYCIACCNMVHY